MSYDSVACGKGSTSHSRREEAKTMITQRAPAAEPEAQPAPAPAEPYRSLTARRVVTEQPETPLAVPRTRVQFVWSIGRYRARQAIRLMVGIIDAIVGLDFVFRLIGAADTGFAHGIMVAGSWLASPFSGIFASVPRIAHVSLTWSDLLVLVLATVIGEVVVRMAGLAGAAARGRVIV
jgi:hypothetical protein